MLLKISRLYDSHTHWLGTGQIAAGLQLFDLKAPDEIRTIQRHPWYFRGNFLVGFGWNFSSLPKTQPTKELLDQVFPDIPVFFSKSDGHGSWLNTLALQHLGFPETHSGLLMEEEHFKAYSSLPPYTDEQVAQSLLRAMKIFHQAGFTHIRDLTCDQQQWEQALKLDQSGHLKLYVEENFLCEAPQFLERTLQTIAKARSEQTSHLKVQGIKIFFDGTLGSDTAMLSCSCHSHGTTTAAAKPELKKTWNLEELEDLLQRAWGQGFEVSVHTIGDEAVHQVVLTARKVMATNKYTGWLNLEHVQVLRPETLQMMKALHVRCFMQPCHWLSDRAWLKEKLGDLYKYAFPWGALSRSGIPLFFGSDTPVARTSFWDNEQALRESKKARIPALKGEASDFHSHPVGTSEPTFTVFQNQKLQQVIFDGKELITES